MTRKNKFIKQTVARDLKTGRFIKMAVTKRRPTTTRVEVVRIPVQQAVA